MKIIIYGAGKIGRAFLGLVFGRADYEVIFVDVNRELVDLINRRGGYMVQILDEKPQDIEIKGVRALHMHQAMELEEEMMDCRLVAISVGQQGLPGVARNLAPALEGKFRKHPERRTDIILAENLRDAAANFGGLLEKELSTDFPLREKLGLIASSIGKMVPELPLDLFREDPLLVRAEAYNTLIVDRDGFLNAIPDIPGLEPCSPIGAWVDRKFFLHNLGHAAAAYLGFYSLPQARYIYEVLMDTGVLERTRDAMSQAASVLMKVHPGVFSPGELEMHREDLLRRFQNPLLGDTLYRVGCDLERKLGRNDRLCTPIRMAHALGLPYRGILDAYLCAYNFNACDEQGEMHPSDKAFLERFREKGLEAMMREHSGLDPSMLPG